MAFYLVICFIIYFNDIKVGRNILINFQLKGILLLAATKKSKTGKKQEKNNTDEINNGENEISGLNSFRSFKFEQSLETEI